MELSMSETIVLLIAIDRMEEHLRELMKERTQHGPLLVERLGACKTIRTKIYQL